MRLCTRNNPSIADTLDAFVREHADDIAPAVGGGEKQRKRLRARIDEVRFRV